jgi:molybdopterin-guanine dinucleotide biosynthesis protein A
VDFGLMEVLFTFWTMFIPTDFPLVKAEFTEELIAIIARVGVKNQLVAKFTV